MNCYTYVLIEQYINGLRVHAYFGHLDRVDAKVGQMVLGGKTIIGTLGKTGEGSVSPHLHLSFRDITDSETKAIQYELGLPPNN